MRKAIFLTLVPVLVGWFFGYQMYEAYASQRSNEMLARGLAAYASRNRAWPTNISSLEPYVSEPETVRLMNPVFQPVSRTEAYVEENQWNALSTQRVSYVVTRNADGTCTIRARSRFQ